MPQLFDTITWMNTTYVTSQTTNTTNIIGIKIPWLTWALRISRVALMNNDSIIHSSHGTGICTLIPLQRKLKG